MSNSVNTQLVCCELTVIQPRTTPNKLESVLVTRESINIFITKARKRENTKREVLFYILFRAFPAAAGCFRD
jgi:hypothetical protein